MNDDIIGISTRGEDRQRSRTGGYGNPTALIVDIPITSLQSESHQFKAEKAQNAIETGAKVSDHVIIQPMSVDITFEISNLVDGEPQAAYDLLEKQFLSQSAVDLITKHKLRKNMVMIDLNMLTQVPLWGTLICRAKFEEMGVFDIQIETAKVNKVKVTPTTKTGGPDASKSAESAKNEGTKPLRSGLDQASEGISNWWSSRNG